MSQNASRNDLVVDTAVGGTLAALGAAAGGPLGAGLAQAATPLISTAVHRVLVRLDADGAVRASRTVAGAASMTDMSEAALVDGMLAHRSKAVLLGRALEGAARSVAEEKIEWFARCIANGYIAGDDAIVDREAFYVHAFSELEAPHIQVLLFLADHEQAGDPAGPPTTDELSDAFAETLCPVIRPILTALERAGLVVKRVAPPRTNDAPQRETGVPHIWQVTNFAGYVLDRIGHTPPDRIRPRRRQ